MLDLVFIERSSNYQLEEALVQGFQTPEEYQAYKELKEHYEEVTGGYSFSKRELTSQLEIGLQNHRGVDFEEHEKEEYLDLVQKLEEFDSSLATHYRQLIRKEKVMNDLLLIPVIFLAVGGILILLWRLFFIASGLFLIGFVSFLIFVEVYGIYLFFTETELYTEDLVQNGLFGFTTFFIIFNLALLVLAGWAGYKWKKE